MVTQQFRKGSLDEPTPLFLSHVKLHKPVTAQRMALKEAGVDTDVFKARSVSLCSIEEGGTHSQYSRLE